MNALYSAIIIGVICIVSIVVLEKIAGKFTDTPHNLVISMMYSGTPSFAVGFAGYMLFQDGETYSGVLVILMSVCMFGSLWIFFKTVMDSQGRE